VELVESSRILWQRRYVVLVALVVALVGGLLLSFRVTSLVPPRLHSRTYTVGEAAAQVLINTTRSQIADINPPAQANLYSVASLLSNLMATGPDQERIARLLDLTPDELYVKPPAASIITAIKPTALGVAGQGVRSGAPSWTLGITVDPNLPLINFTAIAPTPQDARALAAAAISVVTRDVSSVVASERIPANDRVVVDTIGPPAATLALRWTRELYGAGAAVALFLVLCLLIVVVSSARDARGRSGAVSGAQAERGELPPAAARPRPSIAPAAEELTAALPAEERSQAHVG
jgi:hypothetical protein